MATRKITAPQQQPPPTPPPIERLDIDCGLEGMFRLLSRYTEAVGLSDSGHLRYGKLTDSELVALANQARNVRCAATEGLRLMSDMAHAHDSRVNELDMNSFTWLMGHLVDTIEEMETIGSETGIALADRGYDFIGRPMGRALRMDSGEVET